MTKMTRADLEMLDAAADQLPASDWDHAKAIYDLIERFKCQRCNGTGWIPRDPDIGTDQECGCDNGVDND